MIMQENRAPHRAQSSQSKFGDVENGDDNLSAMPAGRCLSRRDWLWGLGAALALRLLVVIAANAQFDAGDARNYNILARSLLDAGVYSFIGPPSYEPSSVRAPLFPFLLTGVYGIFGLRPGVVQLIQVALSLGTVFLLTRCVERHRPANAKTTLWLLALIPFDAFYTALHLTEVLTTFCLTLAVVVPWLWRHRTRWIVAGICWGLTALARDVYLAFALPCALFAVWQIQPRGNTRSNTRGDIGGRWAPLVMIPAMLLVIAPWTVRNYIVFDLFAPVSKGFLGYSLWQGTWERNAQWTTPPQRFPDYAFSNARERELVERIPFTNDEILKQDKFLQALALRRIREQPVATLAVWAQRFPHSWIGTRAELISFDPRVLPVGSVRWKVFKAACFGLNIMLLLLALIGMIAAYQRRDVFFGWLALPPLLNALAYIPLHSTETRYSHPVLPMLLCLSALGLQVMWQKWRSRFSKPRAIDINARVAI